MAHKKKETETQLVESQKVPLHQHVAITRANLVARVPSPHVPTCNVPLEGNRSVISHFLEQTC